MSKYISDASLSEIKDLSIRSWTCKKCNNKNDRDINAAINIMWEGLINNLKLIG